MGYIINLLRTPLIWLFNTINANGILVLLGSFFSGSSDDEQSNYKIGITALISVLVTYFIMKKMR